MTWISGQVVNSASVQTTPWNVFMEDVGALEGRTATERDQTCRNWLTEFDWQNSESLTKANAKKMHLRRMYSWPSGRQLCRTEPRGPDRHQGDHKPPMCTGFLRATQGRVLQTDQRKWTLSSIQHQWDHYCITAVMCFHRTWAAPYKKTWTSWRQSNTGHLVCHGAGAHDREGEAERPGQTVEWMSNLGGNSGPDWTQPFITRPK